jgi:hypothetical protein
MNKSRRASREWNLKFKALQSNAPQAEVEQFEKKIENIRRYGTSRLAWTVSNLQFFSYLHRQ